MKPAYHIPLSEGDLRTLGELTAIIGQIDEAMAATVNGLINADRATTNIIMGSSKVADNANIWSALIKARTADEDVLWLVEHALAEIQSVSKGRNDFIHAFYQMGPFKFKEARTRPDTNDVTVILSAGPATARRIRGEKQRPVAELESVRDQAARLSCLVADIEWRVRVHPPDHPERSPWLERLEPSLPPRLDTAEARKAKAQRAQRPPSQPSLRQRRRDRRHTKD